MYTRGGDKGETGLFGGKRVPKDSATVEAFGAIDELNSCIGVAVSLCRVDHISEALRRIQRQLFVAGADLASEMPPEGDARQVPRITKADTEWLERELDSLVKKLPRLTAFILPGGSALSAQLHLARTVCRRAERRVFSASKTQNLNMEILPFFNRLSTYLFNLARYANQEEERSDELWKEG